MYGKVNTNLGLLQSIVFQTHLQQLKHFNVPEEVVHLPQINVPTDLGHALAILSRLISKKAASSPQTSIQ
jgi:hypothetical protein